MENRIANTYLASEFGTKIRREPDRFGLWMRLGLIGAYILAAALFHLFDSDGNSLATVLVGAIGGALASIAWWRARTVLERADGNVAASRASPRVGAASVGTA